MQTQVRSGRPYSGSSSLVESDRGPHEDKRELVGGGYNLLRELGRLVGITDLVGEKTGGLLGVVT